MSESVEILAQNLSEETFSKNGMSKRQPLNTVSLDTVCAKIIDCPHSTPKWTDYGPIVVRNHNIRDGKLILNEVSCTDETHYLSRTSRIEPSEKDLVITREAPMGQVCMIPSGIRCCLGQRMVLLRVNQSLMLPDFLLYALLSYPVQKHMSEVSGVGSTVSNLRIPFLRALQLPNPDLPEQSAIATALSDAVALIEALDRLIAKKRFIKQATMQQLLTGQTRLPGFEGVWATKRLGEIAHIKTGSRNNADKVVSGEYPFFVRSEHVERINTYAYDCEAIVIPGEGRIGEIFHYIKGRFDLHQRVYAITHFNPEVSARFLHYFMSMKFGAWAMQNTVKATVDSLRLPTFKKFEVVLPQTLEEQTAIATVLSDMDAEIKAQERRRDKARQIKQGMMQQLLTGRVRLVAAEKTQKC